MIDIKELKGKACQQYHDFWQTTITFPDYKLH